jgi:outer membrane protein assembly factor BamD
MYQQAMQDLDDGMYPEALKGFSDIKTRFPYSKFAALSDLRTADTHFARGKQLEAVDAYRSFIKYHPQHELAAYAMLRIGDAYYQQIPEDWWFLPPSTEKDQANTRLAISAYRDMLARFPDAPEAAEARTHLEDCRQKLAVHEMYVAKFYYKREKWLAAARRAEDLLKNYGGLGLDADALWLAADARRKEGNIGAARRHLERLAKDFPESSEADDAADLLRDLPPAPANEPADPGTAPVPASDAPTEGASEGG